MTREKLARAGSNATYDKSCLNFTDEEVARRVRAGEKHVIRMNDGLTQPRITPDDLVFGSLKDAHASLPTDPVLLKSDLFPTYHLASVVDDHEMGITHVIRGEEWLPSLPLHLDLYASLGVTPPRFAHLPLLLNSDGSKMSKRKGDVDVMEFMRRGWEPGAILNWLALAGWGVKHDRFDDSSSSVKAAPGNTAVMTLREMIQEFDLSVLTHRRTILDSTKLECLNKNHLMETWSQPEGLNALANRAIISVKEAFPNSEYTTPDHTKQVILALQSRIINILDIPKLAPYFFVEPDYRSREAESMVKSIPQADIVKILADVVPRLDPVEHWTDDELAVVLHDAVRDLGVPQRVFMTVLRHALSGMKTGPGVAEIMDVLGRERSVARLRGREIVS